MEQTSCVHDSTSNLIFLNDNVFTYDEKKEHLSDEQYKQLARSISSSALIFEPNGAEKRYYYRPLNEKKCLLVGANLQNGVWKVKEYFENPSCSFMLTFFKKFLLSGSITVYLHNEIGNEYFGIKEMIRLGN